MKKYLIIFGFLIMACSAEDENENDCCGTTEEELKESFHQYYSTYFENNPNLSAQDRAAVQAEYDRALKDPCGDYKRKYPEECRD